MSVCGPPLYALLATLIADLSRFSFGPSITLRSLPGRDRGAADAPWEREKGEALALSSIVLDYVPYPIWPPLHFLWCIWNTPLIEALDQSVPTITPM